MRHLDTTDPAKLEAALEAAELGTTALVVGGDGAQHTIHRVPGGWYLPGDLVVASGDVCDGRPSAVALLDGDDLFGDDPWEMR